MNLKTEKQIIQCKDWRKGKPLRDIYIKTNYLTYMEVDSKGRREWTQKKKTQPLSEEIMTKNFQIYCRFQMLKKE